MKVDDLQSHLNCDDLILYLLKFLNIFTLYVLFSVPGYMAHFLAPLLVLQTFIVCWILCCCITESLRFVVLLYKILNICSSK